MHCVSSAIQDQLLLLLVIFPSLSMSVKTKKVTTVSCDHFDDSEDFFSELFFWITVWRASKEQFNFFGTKSNLKGSPLTSKATNGYFGQGVWNWIKGNVPGFEKIRPDANNKNPPITRGNRRQSLPAEIFACIRRYFYLRISLPAAFAGNFARASYTV